MSKTEDYLYGGMAMKLLICIMTFSINAFAATPILDQYFLVGPHNDTYFFAPLAKTHCKEYQVFKDFLANIELEALKSMSDDVFCFFGGYPVYTEYASCLETDNQVVINFQGFISAKTEKGNLLLAEYVKRVNKKTFFNRYLAFLKPEHTVNVFNFEIDGVTTLRYHKDAISFSDAAQEVDEFKKLILTMDKADAVKSFFLGKSIRPNDYENTVQLIEKAKYITFSSSSIVHVENSLREGNGYWNNYHCNPNSLCELVSMQQ
ncbi:MAG: hypothetical protein IPM57_09930 [Oligoflexia bacterium]|nr:hypothetical protein [Oligoflexia bacterium]